MPASVLIALISATPAMINAVLMILADIKASGHPETAPLTPSHVARIQGALALPGPLGDPDGPA
jgi:hypothetical protein